MFMILLSLYLVPPCLLHIGLLFATSSSFQYYAVPLLIYYFAALPAVGAATLLPCLWLRRVHKEAFIPAVSGITHAALHLVFCCTLMRPLLPGSVFLCACGMGLLHSALMPVLHLANRSTENSANSCPHPDSTLSFVPDPEPAAQPIRMVRVTPAFNPRIQNTPPAAAPDSGTPRPQVRRP